MGSLPVGATSTGAGHRERRTLHSKGSSLFRPQILASAPAHTFYLGMGKQRYHFFAQQVVTLISNPGKVYHQGSQHATAVFRVPPSMKKPEIKEYLSSIYGMDVVKVRTANVEGKKKRTQVRPGIPIYYKEADWKKAIVQYNDEPKAA